ncbi:hypothetical protein LTR39_001810, partial [Cryomyces antarcticus]
NVLNKFTAQRRPSTTSHLTDDELRPTTSQSSISSLDFEPEPGKKKWGLFRNLMSSPKARSKSQSVGRQPASPTPSTPPSGSSSLTKTPTNDPQASAERQPMPPPHRNFSFKFSLEYVDKRVTERGGNMRIFPPRLPKPAQQYLQTRSARAHLPFEHRAIKPEGQAVSSSRYSGRALAEWAIIVGECQTFFERRKVEGVPGNKWVETPTLGVEVFRKPG